MAVKKVLKLGNPKLREKSSNIYDFNCELKEILSDLEDTLSYLQQLFGIGRALAAPQIGCMKKVVFCLLPGRRIVMVNPQIIWKSEEMFNVWDTCYSFDVAFFVNTNRHKSIKVEYQDENGLVITEEFTGDLSELFQHEIDHLNGILATDYLMDNRKIIMREEWEKIFR
ncbi:MAG: peptide deformylase [Acetivibrionales bacterium]|jgi:peptide deformylase